MDYYRKTVNKVVNDVKLKMQLGALTLKLNENNNKIDDLIGVDKNIKNDISSNSGLIDTNTSNISSNLGKINNIENDLVDFTTHYSIENIYSHDITLEKEFTLSSSNPEQHVFTYNIENDFKIDSYLEVNTNILYDYKAYSNIGRLSQIFRFYDEKNTLLDEIKLAKTNSGDNLYENLNEKNIFYIKINHNCSTISIKLFIGFLHKTSSNIIVKIINPLKSNCLWVKYYKRIKKLSIDNDLSDLESNISSNTGLISTNTSNISSNKGLIGTNTSSISSNKGLISTNTSSISANKGLIETNTSNISDNSGLISTNTSDISDNSGLISTNTGSIASNLKKINDNKDDITALKTNNIKAFYNLDQIFIYDIEKGNQTVNKDNHFHIFEKEITYNFTKNSYLEIILKVLTEISNYVLIGFFQILCNFYDQDNNLFYTISLSTAMGSINKLSTIKSVFIVPINENMSKIKIDFFIAPKETQQNRSAKFTIRDINSNKIYVKYFQKTEEMSIKDIQDNLNNVKNISNLINGNILKKVFIYDIEFYKKLIFSYTEKSYLIFSKEIEFNFKAYNYIEIYSEILFDYLNHYEIGLLKTEYIFYDDRNIQIEKFEKYQNNSGSSSNNYLITKDYMLFINKSNNTKLKLDIYVSLIKEIKDIEDIHTDFTVKFINNYKNKIYIKYHEK